MPLPTTPPTAHSSLDYEVWAFAFFGDDMFNQNLSSQYQWGTTDYEYLSIVPAVKVVGNLSTGSYNTYRLPGTTDGETSTETKFDFDSFKEKIETIPETRRAINGYYWWPDISIYTKGHDSYYKNTADGMTYDGDTFVSPWLETNTQDTANSIRAFLDRCLEEDVSFDYFIDDKEANDYFWLNGRNTLNYKWLPDTDGDGYPNDPYPSVSYQIKMSDARVMSAMAADSRFTNFVNPNTGYTFAQEFLENYKTITNNTNETRTWEEILSPLINVTTPMGYVPQTSIWQSYGCSGDCGPQGKELIENGYDIFHNVIPAWNCTADELHFNYYLNEAYIQTFKEYEEFENVIYCQYNADPVSHDESFYFQGSNLERELKNPLTDCFTGSALYYSGYSNVIFPNYSYPPNSSFQQSFSLRSGYIKNATNDEEKYNWNGYLVNRYVGPAGNKNIVRYPETNPYINGSYSSYNASKFYTELSFKFVVNNVKRTRTALRSDTTFWQRFTPWIGLPNYYEAPYTRGNNSIAYWYEMVYHLCVSGARFFHVFDSVYNTEQCSHVQEVLDEWRRISGNKRARPCSNSTGNINLPVDRVTLSDAFDKVLVSGGQLIGNGTYLWRLTVAPKYFNKKGVCILQRIGNSTDIPEYIKIDSTNLKNSRGAWVYRQISTPPSYIPMTAEDLNRNNKNDIIRVYQDTENVVYRKQDTVIIQKTSPNKVLVRM